MSVKNINELEQVENVSEDDKIIIETKEGTRSITKSDFQKKIEEDIEDEKDEDKYVTLPEIVSFISTKIKMDNRKWANDCIGYHDVTGKDSEEKVKFYGLPIREDFTNSIWGVTNNVIYHYTISNASGTTSLKCTEYILEYDVIKITNVTKENFSYGSVFFDEYDEQITMSDKDGKTGVALYNGSKCMYFGTSSFESYPKEIIMMESNLESLGTLSYEGGTIELTKD